MIKNKVELFRSKLRQVERLIEDQLKKETCCCGVSSAQCHTILEIGLLQETSLKTLCHVMNLDKSTLSRTVDFLVKAGKVKRIEDPNDRRFSKIRLTEQGQETFKSINLICNQIYNDILSYIPQEKHEQVFESISLLISAMLDYRKRENNDNNEFLCCL